MSRRQRTRSNQRRVDPELQRQARRRSLLRVARALALLLLMGGTLLAGQWLNHQWRVTEWQIDGDAQLKAAIVAQLQAMPSRDFLQTRPQQLRAAWLKAIPDMAEVRIARILPHRLEIHAEARLPMALWQDASGQLYLVDDHGVAYRPIHSGESPDLPLLRVSDEQLPVMQRMIATLQRVNRPMAAQLSEIRERNRHWKIYFSRGVAWLVPKGSEVAVIKRVTTLLKQKRWRKRRWRVDARLASRWFIRPAGHGGVI